MLAPHSHSGFYKTTITKCVLAFSVIFSMVLRMPFAKQRDWFVYNVDDIFENHSMWRLIVCKLAFLNTRDLVCGGFLLYYFRIFERRYGPGKFLSYLLYGIIQTTVCELLIVYFLRWLQFDFHVLPSGPFSLIFSFFVPYFLDIPWFPIAHVLGIPITGKSFPYLFGLQLATTSPETMVVCVCGLLTGLLYEKDILGIQSRCLFPKRFVRFGCEYIGPVFETPPPPDLSKPLGATLELQLQAEIHRREYRLLKARRDAAMHSFSNS